MCEAIAYHHHYQEAPTYTEEVMITCLADLLSYSTILPGDWEEELIRTHPVIADLQLAPEAIDALLARREEVRQLINWMA